VSVKTKQKLKSLEKGQQGRPGLRWFLKEEGLGKPEIFSLERMEHGPI